VLFDSERGPLKHALMKLGDEAAQLHNGSARQIANIAKDTCASYADNLNLHLEKMLDICILPGGGHFCWAAVHFADDLTRALYYVYMLPC
jgi:hypothetical protein